MSLFTPSFASMYTPEWASSLKDYGVHLQTIGTAKAYEDIWLQPLWREEKDVHVKLIMSPYNCSTFPAKIVERCTKLSKMIKTVVDDANTKLAQLRGRPRRSAPAAIGAFLGAAAGGLVSYIMNENNKEELNKFESLLAKQNNHTIRIAKELSGLTETVLQFSTANDDLYLAIHTILTILNKHGLTVTAHSLMNTLEHKILAVWNAARQIEVDLLRYDLNSLTLQQGLLPPSIMPPLELERQLDILKNNTDFKALRKKLLLINTNDYYNHKLVNGYTRTSTKMNFILNIPLADEIVDYLVFRVQFEPFPVQTPEGWKVFQITESADTVFANETKMFQDNQEKWDCVGIEPRKSCIGRLPSATQNKHSCLRAIWTRDHENIVLNCKVIEVMDSQKAVISWRQRFETDNKDLKPIDVLDVSKWINSFPPSNLPPKMFFGEKNRIRDPLLATQDMFLTQLKVNMQAPELLDAHRAFDNYETEKEKFMRQLTSFLSLMRSPKAKTLSKYTSGQYLRYEGEIVLEAPTGNELREEFLRELKTSVLTGSPVVKPNWNKRISQLQQTTNQIAQSPNVGNSSSDPVARKVIAEANSVLFAAEALANATKACEKYAVSAISFAQRTADAKRLAWYNVPEELETINVKMAKNSKDYAETQRLLTQAMETLKRQDKYLSKEEAQRFNYTITDLLTKEISRLSLNLDKTANVSWRAVNETIQRFTTEKMKNHQLPILTTDEVKHMNKTLEALQQALREELRVKNDIHSAVSPLTKEVEGLRERMSGIEDLRNLRFDLQGQLDSIGMQVGSLENEQKQLEEINQKLSNYEEQSAERRNELTNIKKSVESTLAGLKKLQEQIPLSVSDPSYRAPVPVRILVGTVSICSLTLIVTALLQKFGCISGAGLLAITSSLPVADALEIPRIVIPTEQYWQNVKDYWAELALWPICIVLSLLVLKISIQKFFCLIQRKRITIVHYSGRIGKETYGPYLALTITRVTRFVRQDLYDVITMEIPLDLPQTKDTFFEVKPSRIWLAVGHEDVLSPQRLLIRTFDPTKLFFHQLTYYINTDYDYIEWNGGKAPPNFNKRNCYLAEARVIMASHTDTMGWRQLDDEEASTAPPIK